MWFCVWWYMLLFCRPCTAAARHSCLCLPLVSLVFNPADKVDGWIQFRAAFVLIRVDWWEGVAWGGGLFVCLCVWFRVAVRDVCCDDHNIFQK